MILDKLAESSRRRVENEKKIISAERMKELALSMPKKILNLKRLSEAMIYVLYAKSKRHLRPKD